MITLPKLIIAIIVFDRYYNLTRWLECWKQCDQVGELVVIHTGEERGKYKALCDENGVRYIPRVNRGRDIGITQDVFLERLPGFDNNWDLLLWITDDCLPMTKNFIQPFIDSMQPGVGVTAMQISKSVAPHVRTSAYCISKAVSRKIKFPADPILTQQQCYYWEHRGGDNTFTMQIRRMGLSCVQVAPTSVSPLWDTGYGKRLERLNEHKLAFADDKKPLQIHHFYHIYADGKWKDSVSEHIRALQMGLIDNLTTFCIGIVGSIKNRTQVKQYLVEQAMAFDIVAESDTGWEQVTQIPMWEFSQNNEGLILYSHTKGSSNASDVNIRWRRSMTYWNVIRWKDCVEKLKEYKTVGCHFIYPLISMPEHIYGNPMYAGTVYWARAELMRTWMKPPVTHRHESEGWIGYKYVQQPWVLWDWTPYFPNTNEFADGWVNDINFKPSELGISVPAVVLHDKQVTNE